MEILDFRAKPRMDVFFKDHLPEPIEAFKPYYARYHYEPGDIRFQMGTLEATVEEMKSHNIAKAVISATCAEDNIHTFEAINQYPDYFRGMAAVHTSRGVGQAFNALEKAYDEYNFAGFGINPYLENLYSNDRKYYPLYALTEDRGKFVHIHSSFHYNPSTLMELGNPKFIDQIAVDFPKLKIVIGHAGRGFGRMGLWIADRHDNVHLDFTALHPRYVDPILLQMANTLLRKKVIYGSSNPVFHWDCWKLWLKYIKEENQPLYFYENAARLIGDIKEEKKEWDPTLRK